MDYVVVIAARINGVTINFELDTCMSRSVSGSAQIPSFPVQNGDVVSDHMYRDPKQLSLAGSFSLNGRAARNGTDTYTLAHVQSKQFGVDKAWSEYLKNEGLGLKLALSASDALRGSSA